MFASLPARGVWIEILGCGITVTYIKSLPARGVWIEIQDTAGTAVPGSVAPRKGSVD